MKLAGAMIALLAVVAILPATNVHAQSPAPAVDVLEALPYRNIIATGDLFFLIRADVPLSGWCAELDVTTGCPTAPEQPWSLDASKAQFAVYSGCTLVGTTLDCSAGALEQTGHVARIGNLLGGVYFGSGGSVTWAQAGIGVCVESLGATFTVQSSDCMIPLWNAIPSDTDTQLGRLSLDMVSVLRNLEIAAAYPTLSLINQDSLITKSGLVFASEALNVMDRIIPDRFQTGVGGSGPAFATPVSVGNLQVNIDATAVASGLTAALDNSAKNAFGMSGPTLALIGVIGGGMFFSSLLLALTKQPILVSQPIIGALGLGIYFRAPTVATLFGTIVVMGFLASWWIAIKMRQ